MHLARDREAAADLMQEAAYRMFRYRRLFNPQTNFGAWAKTILRHTFINGYRQEKKRAELFALNRTLIDQRLSSSRAYNRGEEELSLAEIHRQIEELDDRFRIPLLLHHEGYTYPEISVMTQAPEGTVKSRVFTARKTLMRRLGRDYRIGGR